MPRKRKIDDVEGIDAKNRKKQRLVDARAIAVQPVASGSGPGVSVTGSSAKVTSDTVKKLPGAIDVEKFAEARAFEINAMQEAMKNTKAASSKRAWQSLPRHLRRRAASHDVRRVPLRLRDKALAEMDPVRRKLARSLPKRGQAKRLTRTESLLRRQRDKTWLETHIWHAKRMHMANTWGYRLAMQPTEKSFRPSHRASVHGSILHDASYLGFVELKGMEKELKATLELCCHPQGPGPGSKRFLTGARVLETYIYKPNSYPFDLIAPITIMWMPVQHASKTLSEKNVAHSSNSTDTPKSGINTKDIKEKEDKGTSKAVTQPSSTASPKQAQTVWICVHPSAFDDVFSALQTAASLVLQAIRRAFGGIAHEEVVVELADLRGQLNVFEIMGPKANQVLKGALTPVPEDKRPEFRKFWHCVGNLQTSGSLPRGMVIGAKVYDPRLKFPPKNAHIQVDSSVQSTAGVVPTATLAHSQVWEEAVRNALKKPRYKKKDLDHRRSQLLVPGTRLAPLRKDDRVPIILIQRSLEPASPSSNTAGLHGWTLILPAGWSMPFFSSLIYTGTRVGGQRERQTQAFESGLAHYPRDYPFTSAYKKYADAREVEEKSRWERKPKSKRPNWIKLETRSPWRANWKVVLGFRGAPEKMFKFDGYFVPTQREEPSVLGEGGEARPGDRPWLLCGAEVASILKICCTNDNPPSMLLLEINKLRAKRQQDSLQNATCAETLWKGALIRVRLSMCNRGSPSDLAMIYCVEDEEARTWRRAPGPVNMIDDELDGPEPERKKPSYQSLIGYITTSSYSLARGEAFSIGAIALSRYLELKQQAHRLGLTALFVKVRDRDSEVSRAATLCPLED